MIVYRLTNRLNGMSYVGITTRGLKRRLADHRRQAAQNPRWVLHRAIQKNGMDAFDAETLEEAADIDALNAAEKRWIAQLGTLHPNGYNLTSGGRGACGFKQSESQRKATGERSRGKVASAETRAKQSEVKRGWRPSSEMREAVRRAQTGRKRSAETCAKIGASNKGRKMSQEAIAKRTASRASYRMPEGAKDALRRKIMAAGVEYSCLLDAAKALGVSITTISRRAERGVEGYSMIGEVRSRRPRTSEQVEAMRSRSSTPVLADGQEFPSMEAAAIALNMTRPGVAYRIKIGRPGYSLL